MKHEARSHRTGGTPGRKRSENRIERPTPKGTPGPYRGRVKQVVDETLKVMLVDGRPSTSGELLRSLESAGCLVVGRVEPSDDLEQAASDCSPDVIIVDLEAPDAVSLDGMRRLGAGNPLPIVMFVDETDRDSIRHAVQAGVAAYVVKGAAAERVRPVLEVAIERFENHRSLAEELREVKSSLAARKLIERAKGVLMEKRGVTENDAFKMMRKMAMRQNMKLDDVAHRVIDMAELL